MCRSEYQLQCIRSYIDNIGILKNITQEQKDHQIQVCQDLVNNKEDGGDCFLDCIIISNEICIRLQFTWWGVTVIILENGHDKLSLHLIVLMPLRKA